MLSGLIESCFDDLALASERLAAINLLASHDQEFMEERLPDDAIAVFPVEMVAMAETIINNLLLSIEHEQERKLANPG